MTLEEICKKLEETGLPVVYLAWPDGAAPALPFICYLETGADPFFADGRTYNAARAIQVELYTDTRDTALEAQVEAVLDWLAPWEKNIEYIKSEHCFAVFYNMEV